MSTNEKPPVSDRGTLASGFTPDAEFHTIPSSKEFADVDAFHEKFGLLRFDTPGHLSTAKLKERIEFLREEFEEFVEASGFVIDIEGDIDVSRNPDQNLAGQADALVDLVYVALGTAVMLGLPWDWLWNDVQRANMAKVRGMTKRGHAVDVTKPEGWQGPQTERVLELAGYNPVEWKKERFDMPRGVILVEVDKEKARDDTQR